MKLFSEYSDEPIAHGKIDAAQIVSASSNFKRDALFLKVAGKEFSGSFILRNGDVIAHRGMTADQARQAADVMIETSADNFRELIMGNVEVLGDDRLLKIGEFDGESVIMDLAKIDEKALVAMLSLNKNGIHIREDGVWLETVEAKTFVSHGEDIELSLSRLVNSYAIGQEDASILQAAYEHAIEEYVEQADLDREDPEIFHEP